MGEEKAFECWSEMKNPVELRESENESKEERNQDERAAS